MKTELKIVGKGETLDLSVLSKQDPASGVFYFGAGWDGTKENPVDLDITCALLVGGKLLSKADYVYYGNKKAPGVQLSEDNTTGVDTDDNGDDEDIVIDTKALSPDVDQIIIGLVAYSGGDLALTPNVHFRVCDGGQFESVQIADIKMGEAVAGDTGLVAFSLTKQSDKSWKLDVMSDFKSIGSGSDAITEWAKPYSG